MPTIQERIKERRLALNLTLLDVAERLGVREATVQRYESGEIKNIKHDTVWKLASILECSPSYLMGWEDDVNETHRSANDIPLVLKNFLNQEDHFLLLLKEVFSEDEIQILLDYKELNEQGKKYIRQTMEMAKNTYRKDISSSDIAVE